MAVFSIYVINKLKDGLGGWEIVSVSVNNHAVCFAHKLERITQDAIYFDDGIGIICCVISNFKSITSVSVPRASSFSNG
jgi:hypothetical protein